MTRSIRTLLVGAAVSVLAFAALGVFPADAGMVPSLQGEVSCNDDGDYEILWTFGTALEATIGFTNLYGDAGVTGMVDFTPNPVPAGTSATGTTIVPGDTTGTVELEVVWTIDTGSDASFAEVELAGDCAQPLDPTTTAQPTGTTTAAVPLERQPSFTG